MATSPTTSRTPVSDRREYQAEVDGQNVTIVELPDVAFEPSPALQAAIENGSVKTSARTVEFKVKVGGKLQKLFRQTYTSCKATNRAGAATLPGIDGDEDKIWDFASARADQTQYQPVYVALKSEAEGPQRKILSTAKNLVALGLHKDRQSAVNALCEQLGIEPFEVEEDEE